MKKYFLILFLILTCFSGTKAQKFKLGFQSGISTFTFTDLKNLNSYFQTTNPFKSKIVSNYPSFFYYQPSISYTNKNFSFGVYYSFTSSGSRISAKDYSGEFTFDTRIKSNTIGITTECYLYRIKKIRSGLYTNIGYSFAKLILKDNVIVWDSVYYSPPKETYKGNYGLFETGLKIGIPFDRYGFELNAGYAYQFFGSYLSYYSHSSKYFLVNPKNFKKLKAQWSGYRIGITFYYLLWEKSN